MHYTGLYEGSVLKKSSYYVIYLNSERRNKDFYYRGLREMCYIKLLTRYLDGVFFFFFSRQTYRAPAGCGRYRFSNAIIYEFDLRRPLPLASWSACTSTIRGPSVRSMTTRITDTPIVFDDLSIRRVDVSRCRFIIFG